MSPQIHNGRIENKSSLIRNGIFYTAAFLLCLWGFWRATALWSHALSVLGTFWAWGGITCAARFYKYGSYDLDNPETPTEEAIDRLPTWYVVPLGIIHGSYGCPQIGLALT